MKIGFRSTKEEYKHLGEWEAQVAGLPQARCYGSSLEECIGRLILTFGKEHGVEFIDPEDVQDQRQQKAN